MESTPAVPSEPPLTALSLRSVSVFVAVGLVAGFLSGLFGIGGGTVIVPALVFVGLTQRRASATSLVAIIPTAIVGVTTYALSSNVNYVAALLLAVGMVIGAQAGSFLLSRLPEKALRWAFVGFLVLVIVQQLVFIPSRDSEVAINVASGLGLLVLGIVTGSLSGLLGIGGGIIVVPALALLFGASDLVAKGTSLLMMIPGAASGTYSNIRRKLVDIRAGLVVGVAACCMTPIGAMVAKILSPQIAQACFSVYLTALVIRSVYAAVRPKPKP
ncbi:MAG: sulfite exporter TauE/SafE family protein [Propionibacteriaceae bacterium]|jgi:uncharacterized membrane protein YfcA|nr:sulfite exporter TauE/SafE family protein [Propionibacteriaceae bacterium]